jgi:hypothetical protein
MSHFKENTKIKEPRKIRSKVVGYVGVPQGVSEVQQEQIKRREFWSSAIDELEHARFNNVDEAMCALIDQAMTRLTVSDDVETREFLYDLLNMDPDFRLEVERSLTIIG